VESPEVFVVPRQWTDDCSTSDGWHFLGNGTYEERTDDAGRAFFMDIAAYTIKRADGSTFSGAPWLVDGMSGGLDTMADGVETELSGGVLVGKTSVFYEDLLLDDSAEVVGGRVGLRDPSGDWWWLRPGPGGCGPVSLADHDLAEACLDLAALKTSLEATP
jgi:hypothetical protein